MLKLKAHRRFEKDVKQALRRGKDVQKLWDIVEQLQEEMPLAARHRPHRLTGEWSPNHECHIEPDWLLIYFISADTLELLRTGTHSDLFG
ncbi:MAG: type II toxin-antitoxin system YafQ family toxin [Alphaproteobacteria bacterium]|nr:type II toxin-antitoxin system YafQ family toxin [Alphaproteobacteria bacterium]